MTQGLLGNLVTAIEHLEAGNARSASGSEGTGSDQPEVPRLEHAAETHTS